MGDTEVEPVSGDGSLRATARPDEAHLRQQRLWELTLRARYAAIVVLAAMTALAVDTLGDARLPALAAIVFLVLPYNVAFDVALRRRGSLPPLMAFTDQLLLVAMLVAFDEVIGALLLFMLGLNATSAVAFGRRVASASFAVGAIGAGLVVMFNNVEGDVPLFLAFAVASTFVVLVVGEIVEAERDLGTRYGELMGGIDAIVWEQLTSRPSTLYVNQRAEELLGYPASAWAEPGFWRSHVHPDDYEEARRIYRNAIRRGEHVEQDYRMVAADGRIVHMRDRMRVETDDLGRAVHVRGVMLDVTDEREAASLAQRYLDLVERIALALFVLRLTTDEAGDALTVVAANPEAAQLCGRNAELCVDRTADEVLTFVEPHMLDELIDIARHGGNASIDDLRLQPTGSGTRVFSAHVFPLADGTVGLSLHDVTDRTMAAEVLRRQALHDALTGLPNRAMLLERLRMAIRAAPEGQTSAALLMMDLNQFKDVNDALGHDHGDRLLIEMSRRLQRELRDADTIARLGGDEFAVLVTGEEASARVDKYATIIHEALEHPFALGGIDVQVSAAIGVVRYPEHGADADSLVQRADVAMYLAKRNGVPVVEYDAEHDRSSIRRLALLGELRKAINEDQLELHYQPSVDLDTGRVGSAEALVRWRHPEHGMVPPAEFIELAELSGLIDPLTRWVLTAGIHQAQAWAEAGTPLRVAMNLSVRNLYDPTLVPWLEELLRREQVDPHLIKLEVTESELMDDPAKAMDVLSEVRAMGVATSIDDFGTGYSSLAYLKHLPIDELKIDRSFVGDMVHDSSDATIVRSTIDLAHNLGLGVVAEGVEDGATLAELAALGCDRAQGYFITRPVPADVCTAWLADSSALDEVRSHLATTSATADR
ncbi:MAG: EAL domain-containing protein [Acidimicrobiia bacterium]|nr:EAL domain-containing protein [Acidimicrobiia bacterium]